MMAVGGVLLGAMLLSTVGMSAVIPGGLTLDPGIGTAVVAPRSAASGPSVAPSPQAGAQEPKGVSAAVAPSGAASSGAPTSGTYQTRHPARPSLADVFSLGTYAFGLVVAAIFGLTPRLFIDRLRSESRAYIRDLQETSPAQSTASVSV